MGFRGYRNIPRTCIYCKKFIGYMKVNAVKCPDCRGLTREEFELSRLEGKK
jgi:hypothetical protein